MFHLTRHACQSAWHAKTSTTHCVIRCTMRHSSTRWTSLWVLDRDARHLPCRYMPNGGKIEDLESLFMLRSRDGNFPVYCVQEEYFREICPRTWSTIRRTQEFTQEINWRQRGGPTSQDPHASHHETSSSGTQLFPSPICQCLEEKLRSFRRKQIHAAGLALRETKWAETSSRLWDYVTLLIEEETAWSRWLRLFTQKSDVADDFDCH